MAFLHLLESPDDFDPEDHELQHQRGCVFFSVPFAVSEDGRWQTMVDAGWHEHYAERPSLVLKSCNFWQFTYEITLLDTFGEFLPESTMNRDIAAEWLPPHSGSAVLDVVSRCYSYIIRNFEPSLVYRVTNERNLTEEALGKYHFLTDVIESEGYSVLVNDFDPEGRPFWLMVRNGFDVTEIVAEDETSGNWS
ncbi:hypothetical protein [Bradyrhizobium sp. CCBAU 53415]|uniref:hypothetical protein n=1 Tax=Bradyrhizobium sp. CCBAU 53415 TaxID=1325119 RepID=UPI002306A669|nr:hypothetical protein [Bradyrhizobium sp. CCBAU 53415]